MKKNPPEPQIVKGQDVDEALERIIKNKDDDIEGTFCFELFELRIFNESLLLELLTDLELVVEYGHLNLPQREVINWIGLCTFRCFTSHFNSLDRYKILSLDSEAYSRWSNVYFERFRAVLSANIS